jgi:NAD(P)-dependent dehydrogenase (short-subunit alcohol dehydrogenase family)
MFACVDKPAGTLAEHWRQRMRFTGRYIIVLGGTSGIGLAVARGAIEEGATVCIASKQREEVEKAREEFKLTESVHLTTETIDVASEPEMKAFFDRIGSFDHLVFTAGDDLPISRLVDKDLTDARARFEIRFWGALAAVKYGVRSIRSGGSIVLTSGFSSKRPRSGWTLQASIQSAIEGVTRALAVELAPIRVNAVSPGLARTPRWNAWTDTARLELYRNEEQRLPVGRVGEAGEIATAYLYLMENTYATGTVIVADGGGALV